MKIHKIIASAFTILFVVLFPALLLSEDVRLVSFNRSYYEKQMEKYNISYATGINKNELDESVDKLLLYMDGKRSNLDFQVNQYNKKVEFFSKQDKMHMVDVKSLFLAVKYIRNICIFFLINYLLYLFTQNKRKEAFIRLSKDLVLACIIGVLPIILLAILMKIDFYKYFTEFHQLFFTNDLWLMDMSRDRLVNIFPEEFFLDTAFTIVGLYICQLVVIAAVAFRFIFTTKKRGEIL